MKLKMRLATMQTLQEDDKTVFACGVEVETLTLEQYKKVINQMDGDTFEVELPEKK